MEKLEEYACEELVQEKCYVHTKELGEVVDMILDCAKTMYQYTVYEAMERGDVDTAMEMRLLQHKHPHLATENEIWINPEKEHHTPTTATK